MKHDDKLDERSDNDPCVPEVVEDERNCLVKLLRINELPIHGIDGPEEDTHGL